MTDPSCHRAALLLALMGTLAMVAHTWSHVSLPRATGTMPSFHRALPDIREWPVHIYLPVG